MANKSIKEEKEEKDIIEKILDENDDSNVFIENTVTGELIEFEQMATITHNNIVYAILSPTISNEDFDEGDGIVFKIIEEDGDDLLVVEDDENIANTIFDIYDEMYSSKYGGNLIYDTTEETEGEE